MIDENNNNLGNVKRKYDKNPLLCGTTNGFPTLPFLFNSPANLGNANKVKYMDNNSNKLINMLGKNSALGVNLK